MTRKTTELAVWSLLPALIITLLFGVSCGRKDSDTRAPEIIKTKSGIEMAMIPGGWFEMGDGGGEGDESPVHKVWVDAFLIDRYEVTQEEYGKLIRGNPSHFKGDRNPVEQMSWSHAALYCNARSRAEGLEPCYDEESAECNFQANGYRLPTEAEWEYACRAGTGTTHFFGREARKLKQYAWYADNSFEKTHPVGRKSPNPWGLYDMYGNVAEWCNDIYATDYYSSSSERNPRGPTEGEKYILRGGSWNSNADSCRSAHRVGEDPGFQDACFSRDDIGFRCVRKVDTDASTQVRMELDAGYSMLDIRYSVLGAGKVEDREDKKTGIVYHSIFLQHETGAGHPERPQRLEAIAQRLGLLGDQVDSPLQIVSPSPASMEWITAIHSSEYIERAKRSCQDGSAYLDSLDTPVSAKSYEVAVMAVGGVLSAIDEVMAGKIRNAFCAIRPPGHHALRDRAMGFCMFNNVGIAARYIQGKYGLKKVLIVDWDVHHGNGTQDAFYDDPTVLYFSTHQYPFYPGTGSAEERGQGQGTGYNINVPLSAGSGDEDYIRVFEEILEPRAMKFSPDFVLISAGFDAHEDDLLGGMNVTAEGFAEMTSIVMDIAEECCDGRIVSVLEGGYELDGLADSVEAHILALQE
jgi:acetoin utilization deacetylase AcuC-like enzyme/formylglycine-generating enzyme required for sulfatase activity